MFWKYTRSQAAFIASVTMLSATSFAAILLGLNALLTVMADSADERKQELHDEARLHKELLAEYSPEYRPVKDHTNAVEVRVRLALKYFSFDAPEETFTLHSWVALMWKDEYLTWNPADYSNIKEIQVESHEIWTPQMALFNADITIYQPDSFYTTCLLANDGTVTCVPHLSHSGICRTSLRSWPYDTQNCTLYFGSWMNTGEQVNFTFYRTGPIVLDDYQNGPGWNMLHVANERLPGKYNCCPNNTYPMLKYTFTLKRESAGPAAIVVVPSIVIVLLTLCSQLLDVKDSTRLVLTCFSLFAHFTFLQEIGYNIPKHSADTPIILLFVRDSMILTVESILMTLILMSLRRRTVPAPRWIVAMNRIVSSGPGKYVIFTEFDPSNIEEKAFTENASSSNINDDTSKVAGDWTQFSNIVNSVVFIILCVVYLILICTYIPKDN